MNILAIDTAAALCAACIYDTEAGTERARVVLDLGKGHAEHVMAVVENALEQAGFSFNDIGAIAVSVGPGSFTGIRVGVSAARGFALALKIPAMGITTLEALAAQTRASFPGRQVLCAVGRTEPFAMGLFDPSGKILDGPRLAGMEDLVNAALTGRPVLAGDVADLVAENAGGDFEKGPLAATADILFYARVAASRPLGQEKPKPLYLRAPDAKPQSGFALPLKG
ncbi:tRNA (adenosine(37)-N6)-threonylcarbamoyltransferase complex dimerization subunit type 1 TsaB [Chelativorans sp. J32]|uniref:tRNA (adenosine(37)-N6)-threonylcarbamoyltransferase complex dimerization subunit type 1 TsaB n=1 Tax=Chelativorans sp. J32 TaxID=935840 RepID=UPI000481E089|nr:tRNA (adenosine(37)-N6)-threonylcarbamoyltransferase complex dimerization subunit type 1 TsaB [Chelativorans sp. J32]